MNLTQEQYAQIVEQFVAAITEANDGCHPEYPVCNDLAGDDWEFLGGGHFSDAYLHKPTGLVVKHSFRYRDSAPLWWRYCHARVGQEWVLPQIYYVTDEPVGSMHPWQTVCVMERLSTTVREAREDKGLSYMHTLAYRIQELLEETEPELMQAVALMGKLDTHDENVMLREGYADPLDPHEWVLIDPVSFGEYE